MLLKIQELICIEEAEEVKWSMYIIHDFFFFFFVKGTLKGT